MAGNWFHEHGLERSWQERLDFGIGIRRDFCLVGLEVICNVRKQLESPVVNAGHHDQGYLSGIEMRKVVA